MINLTEYEYSTGPENPIQQQPSGVSINVKVLSPTGKRNDYKTYVLRDVSLEAIKDVKSLKELILEQFGSSIVSETLKFDLGFYQGNKRIWIRTPEDLSELLHLLRNKGVTLWCDGVHLGKRTAPDDDSSDSEDEPPIGSKQSRKKKKSSFDLRLEQVDNLVDDLREIHGTKFSTIQYRVWAETIVGGSHTDRHNPPSGSFWRVKKKGSSPASSPTTPPRQTSGTSTGGTCITPVRAAELKSTYIKQIKELHSLTEVGALSASDFEKQKEIILEQMNSLSSK